LKRSRNQKSKTDNTIKKSKGLSGPFAHQRSSLASSPATVLAPRASLPTFLAVARPGLRPLPGPSEPVRCSAFLPLRLSHLAVSASFRLGAQCTAYRRAGQRHRLRRAVPFSPLTPCRSCWPSSTCSREGPRSLHHRELTGCPTPGRNAELRLPGACPPRRHPLGVAPRRPDHVKRFNYTTQPPAGEPAAQGGFRPAGRRRRRAVITWPATTAARSSGRAAAPTHRRACPPGPGLGCRGDRSWADLLRRHRGACATRNSPTRSWALAEVASTRPSRRRETGVALAGPDRPSGRSAAPALARAVRPPPHTREVGEAV